MLSKDKEISKLEDYLNYESFWADSFQDALLTHCLW